jgi:hypothetical protein
MTPTLEQAKHLKEKKESDFSFFVSIFFFSDH